MAYYGSPAGVAAYVKHATNGVGEFDSTTTPTLTEVEGFLTRLSARVDGWCAAQGYVVPVAAAQAAAALGEYVNLGGAGLVELAQRTGGYSSEDENRRENRFLKEFGEVREFIESGALGNLGASSTKTIGPLYGLSAGGRAADGGPLTPIFTRGSFGNVPGTDSRADPT